MCQLQCLSLLAMMLFCAAATDAAVPHVGSRCGGPLISNDEGGIFYKYEEPLINSETCIWTVTSKNESFNSLKFDLISNGFDKGGYIFIRILYPTADGTLVTAKNLEHGDNGEFVVPSAVAFVVFSTYWYGTVKATGFILYYEGVNSDEGALGKLPLGDRTHLSGASGETRARYWDPEYHTFVFQTSDINATRPYFELEVDSFFGAAPDLTKFDLWGVKRVAPSSGKDKWLLIRPIATVRGSATGESYEYGTYAQFSAEYRQNLIGLLHGGDSSSIALKWTS